MNGRARTLWYDLPLCLQAQDSGTMLSATNWKLAGLTRGDLGSRCIKGNYLSLQSRSSKQTNIWTKSRPQN